MASVYYLAANLEMIPTHVVSIIIEGNCPPVLRDYDEDLHRCTHYVGN